MNFLKLECIKEIFKNLLENHLARKAKICVKTQVVQIKICSNQDSMKKGGYTRSGDF